MSEAQKRYHEWLLEQDPQEILNHAYEYCLRNDILLTLEYDDISAEQAQVLLQQTDPLSEIFSAYERDSTEQRTAIISCIENRADELIARQKEEIKTDIKERKDTMEIKIYQINSARDTDERMFRGLEPSQEVDSRIYDMVFEGEVEGKRLEDIYHIFNQDHPEGFMGRSLSVSDVVEVVESSSVTPGYYFCDSFGFTPIDFEPDETQTVEKNMIRVVMLEPDKVARITEIPSGLAGLQQTVDGYIEAIYPFEEEDVCLICNEEGKVQGLPLNRAVRYADTITEMSYPELCAYLREAAEKGEQQTAYITFSQDSFSEPYSEEARTYAVSSNNKAFLPNMGGYSIFGYCMDGSDPCARLDHCMADEHGGKDGWKIERCYTKEKGPILDIIAGKCFICGCGGENFGSLTEAQATKYANMFKNPEHFFYLDGELQSVPILSRKSEPER